MWMMFAVLLVLAPTWADAVTVGPTTVLEWDAVVDPNLSGYRVEFGPDAQTLNHLAILGISTSIKLADFRLADGPWCFAVAAYNLGGGIAPLSDPVCVTYSSLMGVPPKVTGMKLKAILEVPLTP